MNHKKKVNACIENVCNYNLNVELNCLHLYI